MKEIYNKKKCLVIYHAGGDETTDEVRETLLLTKNKYSDIFSFI